MTGAHTTTGYHIFIEPPEPLRSVLQDIITTLGGAYENDFFRPHVTLLGRIPLQDEEALIQKVKELSAKTSPFSITLGEIGMEDYYFRALYLFVEKNEVLQSLHDSWTLELHSTDTRIFSPHLSLFYGDLSQVEKVELIKKVTLPQTPEFIVDRVHLYKTEGTVYNWMKIGEYPFGV